MAKKKPKIDKMLETPCSILRKTVENTNSVNRNVFKMNTEHLNIIFKKMTSQLENPQIYHYREASKSESTDDQYSHECSIQKTYKTNVIKYKTEMCKNYSEMGYCPYRTKCQFAHGLQQLHISGPTPKKAYRTKKCKSFWEEGVCRYGFRCQFQHYEDKPCNQQGFLETACQLLCCSKVKGQSRLGKILEISP